MVNTVDADDVVADAGGEMNDAVDATDGAADAACGERFIRASPSSIIRSNL